MVEQNFHFLSYSRREFYFAESLVLHLQEQGVAIWFDHQQLVPRIDWASAIGAGLDNCNGLILIASKAALKSPYVEKEWQAVLAQNKPIYIVLFEDVELPSALETGRIIDFRSDFEQGLGDLRKALRGESLAEEKARPPKKLTKAVRLLASLLNLGWLYALIFTVASLGLLTVPQMLPLLMIDGFIAGYLFYTHKKFLERSYTIPQILIALGLIAFNTVILFGGYTLYPSQSLELRNIPAANLFSLYSFGIAAVDSAVPEDGSAIWYFTRLMFFLSIGLALAGLVAYFRFRRSADILRWHPLGQASDTQRMQFSPYVKAPKLALSSSTIEQKRRYAIYCADADESIANEVSKILDSDSSLIQSTEDSEAIDFPILIISSYTPYALLKELHDTFDSLIILLASSVTMPDELPKFLQYQWIDYRLRSAEALFELSDNLSRQTLGDISGGIKSIPRSANQEIVPDVVKGMAFFSQALGAFSLAVVVGNLIASINPAGMFTYHIGDEEALARANLLSIAFFAVGVLRLWLANGLIKRRISRLHYRILGTIAYFPFLTAGILIAAPFFLTVMQVSQWLPSSINEPIEENLAVKIPVIRTLLVTIGLFLFSLLYYLFFYFPNLGVI